MSKLVWLVVAMVVAVIATQAIAFAITLHYTGSVGAALLITMMGFGGLGGTVLALITIILKFVFRLSFRDLVVTVRES